MNIPLDVAMGLIQALKPQPIKEEDEMYIKDWKRICTDAYQTAIETLEMWGEMEGKKNAEFYGEKDVDNGQV